MRVQQFREKIPVSQSYIDEAMADANAVGVGLCPKCGLITGVEFKRQNDGRYIGTHKQCGETWSVL